MGVFCSESMVHWRQCNLTLPTTEEAGNYTFFFFFSSDRFTVKIKQPRSAGHLSWPISWTVWMVVEDLGKGGPDRGILSRTNKLNVVVLLLGWPGIFRWLRFSQKCRTPTMEEVLQYFFLCLICSFKVWICMSEWWTACACVCLMPGFSSKRMEKHWAFYFRESCVLFFFPSFAWSSDAHSHILPVNAVCQMCFCVQLQRWWMRTCVFLGIKLSLGVQLDAPAVWLSVSV